MKPATDLLNTAEVAARLGKSVPTINRWVIEGRIAVAFKAPGGHGANLFDPAEVERLEGVEAAAS